MADRTPSWGITPVPERLRVLTGLDSALLWGNLSVSLLVIVIGALLVPALSLRDAMLAIVVGAVIGNLLLGVAALIGADARVPGMVLLRAPLGRRGSYAPTVLNVAQNLGWSTFELIIIAAAAAALSEHVFGWKGTWLWTILFGILSWGLGMLGPIGFVRRYLRKFASWALLFSMAYLTYWAVAKSHLHAFWAQPGKGGFPTFGQAVDLVIGSVHSHMNLEAAEMTDRLLRAIECPHLRILGHPTGRLLLHRDPFPFDFDRIVAEAVRRAVWLEINASPERLDLSGALVRTAKAKGAKFTISTDAHHPKHLASMRYGVVTARRGWLGRGDIMNTLPVDRFAAALQSRS